MANLIYGINANGGLSELVSKTKALETLGLKINDLNKVGDTGQANVDLSNKINVNQFHHLSMASGSPNAAFSENILDRIDRYAKSSQKLTRRLEEFAGPPIDSSSGIDTSSIQGNIVVNGPIGAPSIRYFSTEQLNANTGEFEPLDISTSRVSSWNTSKPTLSFGGDVTIESLSPAAGSGNPTLKLLPNLSKPEGNETPKVHVGIIRIDGRTQEQPITTRAFAAETATHKLKVKINGEEMFLYAMKNIPLVFNGNFKGFGPTPTGGDSGYPQFLAKRHPGAAGVNPTDYRIFLNGNQELEYRSGDTNYADTLYFNSSVTRSRTLEVYQDPSQIGELIAYTKGSAGLNITNFPNAEYTNLTVLKFPRNSISTVPNLTEITKDSGGTSNLTECDFSLNRFYESPDGSLPNLNRITELSLSRFPKSLQILRIGQAFGKQGNAINKKSAVSETFKRRFLNLTNLDINFDDTNTLNSPVLPEIPASVTSYNFKRQSFKTLPGTSVVQRFDLNNMQSGVASTIGHPTKPARVKIRRALNFFKVELESPGVGYIADTDGSIIDTKVLTKTGAASPEGIPFGHLKLNTGSSGEVLSAHFHPYHNPYEWTQQRITERAKPNGEVFTRLPHVKDGNYSPMSYYVDCGFLSSPTQLTGYDFEHMDATVYSKYDAFMNPFYDTGVGLTAQEFGNVSTGTGSALKGSTYNGIHHNVYKNDANTRTMNQLLCSSSHLPVPFFVNYSTGKNLLNINHDSVHPKSEGMLDQAIEKVSDYIYGVERASMYNYTQMFTYYDSPQSFEADPSYTHKRGTNGVYKLLSASNVQSIRCNGSTLGGTVPNFQGNTNLKTVDFNDTIFNRFQRSFDDSKEVHLPIRQFSDCVAGIQTFKLTKASAPRIVSNGIDYKAFGEATDDAGTKVARVAGYQTLPVERIGASYGYGSTSANWVFPSYGGDVGTATEIKDGDFSTDILGGSLTKFICQLRNKDDGDINDVFKVNNNDLDVTGIPRYGGLTGDIPTFKNATVLSELDLSYNSLTGKLDDFTATYNQDLKKLYLNNNKIRGKLNLSQLANGSSGTTTGLNLLEELILEQNNIEEIENFGAANQTFNALTLIKCKDAFDCPSYSNGAMQIRLEPTSTPHNNNGQRWLLDRRKDGTSSKYEKTIPTLSLNPGSSTSMFPSLNTLDLSVDPPSDRTGKFIKFDTIDENMFLGCPNIKKILLGGNGFSKLDIIEVLKAVRKLMLTYSYARNITVDFSYQRGFDSPKGSDPLAGTGMPGTSGRTDFRILQPSDNINSYHPDSVYRKGRDLVNAGVLQESDLNYNSLEHVDLITQIKHRRYGLTLNGIHHRSISSLPSAPSRLFVDFFANQTNRFQDSRLVTGSNEGNQVINLYNWDPTIVQGQLTIGGIDRNRVKRIEVEMISYDGTVIPLDGTNGNPNYTLETDSGRLSSTYVFNFTLNMATSTNPIWKGNSTAPYILDPALAEADTNFADNEQSVTFRIKAYGTRELISGGDPKVRTRTYTFRNQVATRTESDPSDASHPMGEWKETVYDEEE